MKVSVAFAGSLLSVLSCLIAAPPSSAAELVAAAQRGDLEAVVAGLAAGGKAVEEVDDQGYSALHWAAIRGHWDVFARLMEAGAPVDRVGADGGTPLHWACHHDRPLEVAQLLDAGADPQARNRWGRTPLHVAVRRDCYEVAQLLLRRGADPDTKTHEGWTALHVAYKSGHERMPELLFSAGAKQDALDEEGKRPIEHAFQRPAAIDLAAEKLDDYVGEYDLGQGFHALVWRQGETLWLRDFAPDRLIPVGEDAFFCQREPWRIEFQRTADGTVDSVDLHFLRRTISGQRQGEPAFAGARSCAGCHSRGAGGEPYIAWLSGRHALAYWRLATDWAKFLASRRETYSHIDSPIEAEECLNCHVTNGHYPTSALGADFDETEGVGCEACHGPGSLYSDAEIMADRQRFLANGGRIPGAETCRRCHRDEGFDYDAWRPKLHHPMPAG